MSNHFYTVTQISEMLNIHPKTIQRYIREGKLQATKIGKSWRISGHDLSLFTEQDSQSLLEARPRTPIEPQTKAGKLTATASSVVDIKVNTRDEAIRIMNTLTAALNAKPSEFGQSSLHSQFIERESLVRVTLWGEIQFVAIMMDTLSLLIEPRQDL